MVGPFTIDYDIRIFKENRCGTGIRLGIYVILFLFFEGPSLVYIVKIKFTYLFFSEYQSKRFLIVTFKNKKLERPCHPDYEKLVCYTHKDRKISS